MSKKALFIDSLNYVEIINKNKKKYEDSIICTIYTTVYLQCKKYSINCVDLNSLITNDDIKREHDNSIDTFINFLHELDNNNKENLKFFDDLPTLDWFFSLFRYEALIDYISLNILSIVLEKFLKINKIDTFEILSQPEKESIFIKNEDCYEFISDLLKRKNISTEIKTLKENDNNFKQLNKTNIKNFIKDKFIYLLNYRFYIKSFFFKKESNSILLDKEIKYKEIYSGENILTLRGTKRNSNKKNDDNFQFKIDKILDKIRNEYCENYELKFLKKKICDYLSINYINYIHQLIELNKTIDKYKIKKVYWLSPPNTANINSLIVNFLSKKKIDVIGLQHGGSYGLFRSDSIIDKIHALSDYFFCNTFLSYGDIKLEKNVNLYSKFKLCKFKKIGSLDIKNFVNTKKIKENITNKRILFPVNLTQSILKTKQPIMTSSDRSHLIKEIYEEFEKKTNDVIIKLYPGIDYRFITKYYPAVPIMDNFKSFKTCELSLMKSLQKHRPGLVIIDEISTPLYEVLPFNCEIICFEETFHIFKKEVFNKLEKRVHFVKNIDDFREKFNLFFDDKLKIKRDNSFLKSEILNI